MSWLRYLRRDRRTRELGDEIESYIAITVDENIAAGMTREQATDAARRKFGNTTLVKEKVRDMNSLTWLEDAWNDLRHGARLLRLSPGFFAVATLSLALGIGANTAIFQLLDAVRLRTLPVAQPQQLAQVQMEDNEHCCDGSFSTSHPDLSYALWEQIRDHQQAFSGIFAFADARFNLAERGEVRKAEGLMVSGNFFRTLGVNPVLGRTLTSDDDPPGGGACGSPAAVISYAFWQREYGSAADVVGRKLMLNSHPFEIAGVADPGFYGVEVGRSFDVAVPLCAEGFMFGENSRTLRRDAWWLAAIGRLKPGWTVAKAAAQMAVISKPAFEATLPSDYRPDDAKWYLTYKFTAKPAGAGVSELRSDYEDPLWLLLAIAGAVLLIACANLANLMLARASVREREMAVRIAIGAGRGRLVRQMLAESALLTLAGLVAGALVAQWLSHYLVGFLRTPDNRLFLDLGIDWRILGFISAIGIVTCLLFGAAPALRAAATSPGVAMKSGGRAVTSDRSRFGLRRSLVVVQVALSLVLLTGALLFGRSLNNLNTQDAGIDEDGLLIVKVDVSNSNVPAARRTQEFQQLVTRLRSTPGVDQAAAASIVQLSGSGFNPPIEMIGMPPLKDPPNTWFNRVTSGYFSTVGTRMLEGRDFDDHDTLASPEVAIVTQQFQRAYLNGADPIGKHFRIRTGLGEGKHVYEIVGLVKDSKYRSLSDPTEPLVYIALGQEANPRGAMNFLVRSRQALGPLTAGIMSGLMEKNPNLAVQFQVFKTQVQNSLLRQRLMATLSGFFGLLAEVLASVGLYGVISYMVARRRNEIGIRVALGASRSSIVQLVFREAAVLLAIGIAIGVALTIGGLRVTKALLYGLSAHDPVTIALAVALLAAVSLVASWLPAMRASRLDPVQALREE
ncbi:MAG TPA: ABC transporter permease [Bryobacteraceae bacterium]|jgi:predicted permease